MHTQRVVCCGDSGQHRAHVGLAHIGAKPEDHRDAPPADIAEPVLQEVRDIRRDRRVHRVVEHLTRQAPLGVPRRQHLGQRGHRLVLVQILGGQIETFMARGHRDTDRDQRVTADLEEVRVALDGGHAEALRPNPLQRRLHRGGAAGSRGRRTRRRARGAHPGGARAVGDPRRTGVVLDPVALLGERITGKSDQLVRHVRTLVPVDLYVCGPQLTQRQQERLVVAAILGLMPHQPHRAVAFGPARVASRRRRQRAAGTDLDEHPVRQGQQRVEFIGETHGGPDLAGPRGGIGRFGCGHRRASDIGQQRDSRFVQRHP